MRLPIRGKCLLSSEYRVVYQLVDDGQTVRVVAVRHRAVAYETDPR